MARSYRSIAVAAVAVLALAMPVLAAQAKAAKAKTMTISGTLQKVDGQTLTVQTPTGSETVMLAPSAKIRRAGKTVSASELGGESGSRVRVRYTENAGQKMAQSVTLAAAKSAAAAKPAARAKPAAAARPAASAAPATAAKVAKK